eukprot:CAMPEP_0181082280 /NCGR_PEP_ID=MMETSP1071-20121207/3536_1 /TAXON_ID=35127 /ORGANISM="Thalassiosira sp., Strain NH16" /LENGTH=310 /DNA_ID=CAMNT_0023163853 /DNA_START=170 /DNA_END=1103 /DNA_ORIENTATION=+
MKAPPEESIAGAKPNKVAPIISEISQIDDQRPKVEQMQHQQQQQQPIFPVATAPFPHLNASVSPTPTQSNQAQLTATQALYETMGYPTGAARVAASTFSHLIGLTGSTPSATTNALASSSASNNLAVGPSNLDMKPSGTFVASSTQQLPSVEEVGSDKYVASLEKFAMQQTAAANAAAAAANTAIQALNWHKMMMKKSNGDGDRKNPPEPTATSLFAPTVSVPLTTSSGSTTVSVPLATVTTAPLTAASSTSATIMTPNTAPLTAPLSTSASTMASNTAPLTATFSTSATTMPPDTSSEDLEPPTKKQKS